MGASSERTQGGENKGFNSPKHDDCDAGALEAPAHRDRDAAISLREANSSRAVRLPVNLHPPSAHSCAHALWQVSRLVRPPRMTSWSRYDRQDGDHRPGAAAPAWRACSARLPAAHSSRCWSPSWPRPPSSSRSALATPFALQQPPAHALTVCRRLLRNLVGRHGEGAARTLSFRF